MNSQYDFRSVEELVQKFQMLLAKKDQGQSLSNSDIGFIEAATNFSKEELYGNIINASPEDNVLLKAINTVEDFRCPIRRRYPLNEILLSAIVAIICGANSWESIAIYAHHKLSFLRKYLPFNKETPAHDTYTRVFAKLNPDSLEKLFQYIYKEIASTRKNHGPSHVENIAVDGKCMKATANGGTPVHMVTAWSGHLGVSLAQTAVPNKSNEIKAIPLLLSKLDISGANISMDAMGTQVDIAKLISNKDGYYLLALKGNQKNTFNLAQELFANNQPTAEYNAEAICEKGNVIEYVCQTISGDMIPVSIKEKWEGLTTLVRVHKSTYKKINRKYMREDRYYIANSQFTPETYLNLSKEHWDIERTLHWSLDMNFGEDKCRKSIGSSGENYSRLLRIGVMMSNKHYSNWKSSENQSFRLFQSFNISSDKMLHTTLSALNT